MQDLNQLLKHATKYSLHHLHRSNRVPPTLLATTPDGVMAYVPKKIASDSDKDNFALIARLITVAYQAETVAMVLESWLTLGPDASLPGTSPSQSPNRKEAVVIMAETRHSSAQRFLFIERNALGRFTGIGPNLMPHFDSMQGRFAQILLPHRPSKIDAEKARTFLRAMGIVVVHKGTDPRWN